jgi:two-component system chemotaxis response regulator CheY
MRVLIAEDDKIGRKLLEKFFDQYGESDIAIDGIAALEAFIKSVETKSYYDLVCLDIMMPKMDGLKALAAMRDIEKKQQVKKENQARIVMITALNDKKTVDDAYRLGCDAYAWKPIHLDRFREVLEELSLIEA